MLIVGLSLLFKVFELLDLSRFTLQLLLELLVDLFYFLKQACLLLFEGFKFSLQALYLLLVAKDDLVLLGEKLALLSLLAA